MEMLKMLQQQTEAEDDNQVPPPPPPPPKNGNESESATSSSGVGAANVMRRIPLVPREESDRLELIRLLDPADMKFPPPSPRTAKSSAEAGRKGVGILKFLDLHQMVAQSLQPNVRGERDFKALSNAVKAGDNSEEMQRLLKNLRQEVKKLYGERRKRKQLVAWDKLEQAVGIRDNSRARVDAVNREEVMKKALQVETTVSKWFMDRSIFDDYFVRELSVHLIGLLGRGEKSPGSVLNMPRVVIDKIVKLHLERCKDRFHELHRMFFSDLFTPADIEIAVLSACDCDSCVSDWHVNKIDQRHVDPHVRFHWTKKKAEQAAMLLRAHLKYGNEASTELAGQNLPKMRSWNESDFKGVLRCVHTCASCFLCQKRQMSRRPLLGHLGMINPSELQGLPHSVPESQYTSILLPASSAITSSFNSASPARITRAKDTPQTRKIGMDAKRAIRQALAEQTEKTTSKRTKATDSPPQQPELHDERMILEHALLRPETLLRLASKGLLADAGITFTPDGQVHVAAELPVRKEGARPAEVLPDPALLNLSSHDLEQMVLALQSSEEILAGVKEVLNDPMEANGYRSMLNEVSHGSAI